MAWEGHRGWCGSEVTGGVPFAGRASLSAVEDPWSRSAGDRIAARARTRCGAVTLESLLGTNNLRSIAPTSSGSYIFESGDNQIPQGSVRVTAAGSRTDPFNYAAYDAGTEKKPVKATR